MTPQFDFILTIDQGNTLTKCALFSVDKKLITSFPFDKFKSILKNYNLSTLNTKFIKVSVTDRKEEFPLTTLDVKSYFKNAHFLNMPVNYNETIGLDRLVASYYCYGHENKSYLVIDTGTFTTIDSVDIKGFNGGYILPGLNTIEKSYSQGSHLAIPDTINTKLSFNFPNTTQLAIHQGAIISYLAPIKEIIIQTRPSNLLITGGNGEILYKYLYSEKKSLFRPDASIQLEQSLVHNALAEIAYNSFK